MMRRAPAQRLLGPMLLAAAVLLAGCGPAAPSSTSSGRPLTGLRVGCGREVSEAFLWNVGVFASKYGINPECVEFASYPESMQAVVRGDVDIGYMGIPQISTVADSRITNVRVVAGFSLGGQNIVLRKGLSADSWSSLEGRRVCAPLPTGTGIMLQIALIENHVDLSRINLVDSGFVGQVSLQALRSGSCDALAMWSPIVDTAVVDGYGHYEVPQLDLNSTSLGPANGVMLAGPRLLRDSSLLVDFLKAFTESLEYMRSHPDRWVDIAVQLTGVRPEVVREALKHQGLSYNLDVRAARLAARYGPRFGFAKSDASDQVGAVIDASFLARATGQSIATVTQPVHLP